MEAGRLAPTPVMVDFAMSKLLNMGMRLDEVVGCSTWHSAREIHHEELGNRSRGVVADIAVLWLVPDFGFAASARVGLRSNQKFVAEMTLRAGRVVWDLNGMSSREWNDAGC